MCRGHEAAHLSRFRDIELRQLNPGLYGPGRAGALLLRHSHQRGHRLETRSMLERRRHATSNNSYWRRIARDRLVGGEQNDPLHKCLRDENTIERILVQRRQGIDRNHMLACDGQFAVAVVEQSSPLKSSRPKPRLITISERLESEGATSGASPEACSLRSKAASRHAA